MIIKTVTLPTPHLKGFNLDGTPCYVETNDQYTVYACTQHEFEQKVEDLKKSIKASVINRSSRPSNKRTRMSLANERS